MSKIQIKKSGRGYILEISNLLIYVKKSELKVLRNAIFKALAKKDPDLIYGEKK